MTEIQTFGHDDLTNISGFDIVSKELLGGIHLSEQPSAINTLNKNTMKRLSDEQNSVISSETDMDQLNSKKQFNLYQSEELNTFKSYSSKNNSMKKIILQKNLALQFSKKIPQTNTSLGTYQMKCDKHARNKFTAIM